MAAKIEPTAAPAQRVRWHALFDLAALLYTLALAWFLKWETKDLVWSLWLSSLTVGYASIVLSIFGGIFRQKPTPAKIPRPTKLTGSVWGRLFLLAFFTLHFGMFHFVHSVFLNGFFPVMDRKEFPGLDLYVEVVRTYWPFVIAAAIAERRNLQLAAAGTKAADTNIIRPYRNVVRMHLLIFFFAGAAGLKLHSFLIHAVVLVVYFFPWAALNDLCGARSRKPAAPRVSTVAD